MLNGTNTGGFMGKKILVVDDEPDLLKVLLTRLKKTGYQVFGGVDGQEALDLARQIRPDLIIIDVYLPDMNGDDVAKILKEDKELKHIHIMLISPMASSLAGGVGERGREVYLPKPFEPEELIGAVKNILE